MNKKFVFYTLILTVFINSFNGFSKNAKASNHSLGITTTNTYTPSFSTYISVISDFEHTNQSHAIYRNINFCPSSSITVNVDPGTCAAVVSSILPTTDISGGSMFLITPLGDGDTFPVGTTSVTYEERDATNSSTGNTCTFDVTVVDNVSPITPTLNAITVDCTGTLTAPTTTDVCAGTITGTTTDTLAFSEGGSSIINWTFNDGNGNSISVPQTYTYNDTTDPVTPTLNAITVDCTGTLTAPTTTDVCSGTITGTTTDTLAFSEGASSIINWTFNDGNGNSISVPQTYTYNDTADPVTPILNAVTVDCTGTLTAPTTTDVCAGTITGTTTDTLAFSEGASSIINWTFDDGNGNIISVPQTYNYNDTTDPVTLTLNAVTVDCTGILTAPTTTDVCAGTITGTTTDTLMFSEGGSTIINWTFDDDNGNSISVPQTYTYDDTTDPVTPTLNAVTVDCTGTLTAPTTTDVCSGTITGTTTDTLTFSEGASSIINWTFDDGNGNIISVPQTYNYDDTTNPVTPTLNAVTVDCTGTLTIPTTTDVCAGTITGTTTDTLTFSEGGSSIINWTFNDGNGNSISVPQTYNYDDTTDPITPTLNNVTVDCTGTLTIPTTTDVCAGTITGTTTDTLTFSEGASSIINWTFDDGNGNIISVPQTYTYDDTTDPVTPILTDIIDQCSVSITPPTTTDPCAGTITGTTMTTFPITTQGTTVVTWTFDDGNGNVITANQNVLVADTTDPLTPTLTDVTAQCEVTTLTTPTATDNCSGIITGTTTTTFPISTQGTTVVIWTFDDGNGNTITQTQNVIINDTIPPTFDSCPSNLSRNNDARACGAIVNFTVPTATDTCGIVSVTQTDVTGLTSGSLFPIGTTTIEYTATDGHGNNTICSFTVIVADVEIPTITCPTNITVNADTNCEAATVTLGTPTTNDNCGVATITNDLTLPLPVGTHTITWTVSDTAGLTATCTQTVTVQDVTAPVISCPGDITVNVDSGLCSASGVNLGIPTITDNCGAGYTNDAPSLFPIGETIVTWTATDGSGLMDTCTQTVTVEPILVCQNITIQLDNTGNATILSEDIYNGISCASFNLSVSQTSFDCGDLGNNTVTLTATDNASNVYICNATVTIIDFPSNADLTISTPETSVCSTSFETFTATATNIGSATPIYYWYVDGTLVQSTTSNIYTPSGFTFGTYTVEASIGPCTLKVESNTILINVYDNPPNTPIISGPTGLVCPTTTVTLSVPADSNVESYNWSVPSELQITNNNGNEIEVYIDNTVLTQNTYTVNLTLDNPCGSASNSFEIAINDNSASINAGPDIYLCASDLDSNGNGSITMNGDADWVPLLFWGWNDNGAGGTFSEDACLISWFFGCLVDDNSETDTYYIQNAQPGDVITITLETYGEDSITDCGAPVFDEMRIHILEETEAEITSSDTTICEGDSTIISFEGTENSQIRVNDGSGNVWYDIEPDGTYSLTVSPLTTTTYTLNRTRYHQNTYPGNNNCPNAITNEFVTITVNQPATISTFNYGTGIYCESNSNITATLNGTNAYTGGSYSSTPTGLSINSATGTINPSASTPGTYTITYTTPSTMGCGESSASTTVTIQEAVLAEAGSIVIDTNNCGSTSIALTASAFATGIIGEWTVTSGPVRYNFSDINDPNAIFTGESNGSYTLEWLATNSNICGTLSDIVSFTMPDNCGTLIDFDGTNDHINFNDSYTLGGNFSLEIWVKPNAINGNIQTIISKRNANNLNSGYDLRLINNSISFRWNAAGSIIGNGITANRWYHIAVSYNSGTYRLYIDGILINTTAGIIPVANNFDFLAGAMSRTNQAPTNYFNGWLDEFKIWNAALSPTQIREMMNQEIEPNGNLVRGSVIPENISGPLNWNTDLLGYYKMNQSSDISNGILDTNSISGATGNLINMNTLQAETAPLPYISSNNGNWATAGTWLNGTVQQIPNSNGVNGTPVNWNIVRTQHNVTSGNRATTLLGLLVDANTFTINNDQVLTVNNYLNIDSVLDLEGQSQLLQPMGSEVDYSGTGALHRDQQGTTNLFNYNYWGSPVSTNGSSYQISALHDGLNPVNWTGADDATGSTNPVTLSNRWLYLYENHTAGNYADWNIINQTYDIPVGLGFTMKGSGVGDPITDFQNYTFVGQPNNGTITTPVTGGNEALVGNPYPSAIDADLFILDNVGSITGPLYFWEHSKTNASHITADYEGGYATYSLTGGVAATTPPIGLGSIGSVSLIPRKHITVGQGFYVTGDADGGNITFNNSQRAFVKETPSTSVFLRTDDDIDTSDLVKRVRLNFTSPEGALRPLLLGFTPNNEASEGFDYGYDALNTDYYPSDMSFIIEGEKYVIQGVGAFTTENMYPVTIDLGTSGNIQIALGELENFDEEIDVFIYDALLGTYTRINTTNYQVALDPGSHSDRYFISFKDGSALNTPDEQFSNVVINYLTATSEIYINVPTSVDIKQVYLVNLLGQTVKSWNGTNAPLSHECRLPVNKISEGTYIIKVRTSDNALINKKIVVKQ